MATAGKKDARLNLRLPDEARVVIERAAAVLGQSVEQYALSTLIMDAQTILSENAVTVLSDRDRDRLLAILDDEDSKPNQALMEAAEYYKKEMMNRSSETP
ncbi:MAG: DUF1778 domain-containing protein [Planctomycetaceae bacterium]